MNFLPRKGVPSSAFEDGGNCSWCKIWIKPKELSVKAFFTLFSSFYTSRGGGSEAPIRQLARWGLLLNRHRTSLAEKKSNFNTRVCFTITFAWLVRAVAHFNNFRNGAERSNNLNEAKYDDSNLLALPLGHLWWFVKNWAGSEGGWVTLRQKLPYDCRSAKRFYVRRTALVAHLCRANRWFFITDF
jgi:hypothetical protein